MAYGKNSFVGFVIVVVVVLFGISIGGVIVMNVNTTHSADIELFKDAQCAVLDAHVRIDTLF